MNSKISYYSTLCNIIFACLILSHEIILIFMLYFSAYVICVQLGAVTFKAHPMSPRESVGYNYTYL